MVRAALYLRISKDIAGTGLGVERQQELCLALAASKGWDATFVYTDNDISAFTGAPRPAYQEMLEAMEAGTIDAVVCVDQDRLTRHPAELESFIALADAKGILLANVSGEVDLSSSDGRFRARIMGAVARQESEKKAERLRRQKEQSAARGWAAGGQRRYGYTYARTPEGHPTMTIVPHEAEIVREIAQRFLDGDTLRSLVIDLNRRGIPTATGKQWKVPTVRRILSGAHHAGLRMFRGKVVGPANWEPILDRVTWERVRALMGDPTRTGPRSRHLLVGLLHCSRCGGRMHYNKATSGDRYRCDAPPEGCGGISVMAARVEEHVLALAWEAINVPEMDAILNQNDSLAQPSSAELQGIEESMLSLARLYAAGRIGEGEWLAARDALEQRQAELAEGSMPSSPSRPLAELWDNADTESRRLVLSELFLRIDVLPGKRGHRFDGGRLAITWR